MESETPQPVATPAMANPPPANDSSLELPGAFGLFKPSWQAFKLNWVIFVFGILPPAVIGLILVAILQIGVHSSGSSQSTTQLSNASTTTVNIISLVVGV